MCYCNAVLFDTKINNCCKACSISLPTWGENKWGAKFLRLQWNSQNIKSERPLKLFHIIKTVKATVYRGQSCYKGVSTKLRTWSTCVSYSQMVCWRISLLMLFQLFCAAFFNHRCYPNKGTQLLGVKEDYIVPSVRLNNLSAHLPVDRVLDKALLNNSIHSSLVTVAQVRNW